MKHTLSGFLFIASLLSIHAQQTTYLYLDNIPYYPESAAHADDYLRERCVLDLYCPQELKDFPTVVWFHGGGLTGGNKFIPEALNEQGMAVVAVNYRLYPKIKAPVYIEDAAAAGGYLTSMVGLDPRWLEKHDVDANRIAGLIPFSGHAITHFTVREERGIGGTQPVVDDLAPLFHVRKDAPPLLLITGDRELEMLGRYEVRRIAAMKNQHVW